MNTKKEHIYLVHGEYVKFVTYQTKANSKAEAHERALARLRRMARQDRALMGSVKIDLENIHEITDELKATGSGWKDGV